MSKEKRKNIVQNMFKNICIASLMLGYMFALTSCEKEKDGLEFIPYEIAEKTSADYNTFEFSTAEDMYNELEKILAMRTTEELVAYENIKGYTSIGRLSDVFYDSIDPQEFSSEAMAIEFLQQNDHYVILKDSEGKKSAQPIYEGNPYRYFASANGMFKVGNNLIKVFESGNVVTNISNISALTALTENDLFRIKDDSILMYYPYGEQYWAVNDGNPPFPGTNLHDHCYNMPIGSSFGSTASRGDYQITATLNFGILPMLGENYTYDRAISLYSMTIYTKKKFLGIWWKMRHEIYGSFRLEAHVTSDAGNTWEGRVYTHQFNGERGKPWNCNIYGGLHPIDVRLYQLHYTSINVNVRTDHAGPATINETY